MSDTIVAIITPKGIGAVGVVRLSGDDSKKIATSFLSKKTDYEPNKLYLTTCQMGQVKDQVLAVHFKGPKSFTGEDVFEIQCHGGQVILESILKEVIKNGGRIAENGEFTKRGFLNGKMSLTSVEGLCDLIEAESENESKVAYDLFQGGFGTSCEKMQSVLMEIMLFAEASFDYPEEEMPIVSNSEILSQITEIRNEILSLLQTEDQGKTIKNGLRIAIVGLPNAGKSSILNAILGEERAIVTELEGTTRDVLEVRFNFKGSKFTFFDTAGLRETEDTVEKIGVQRGKDTMRKSDFVMFVVDSEKGISAEELEIISTLDPKRTIICWNKEDKKKPSSVVGFTNLSISAKDRTGLDALKNTLHGFAGISSSQTILTNQRHLSALKMCNEVLEELLQNFLEMTTDCIILDVRKAWEILGQITGTCQSEEIIDNIFSRLCLGK